MEKDDANAAVFLHAAINDLCNLQQPENVRVLDFGCGRGRLVESLRSLGYDAHGCDIRPYWQSTSSVKDRLAVISFSPYKLPFKDQIFDVVVSTSVLEHAQNKEELFLEISRVLKKGGFSMHLYPGKWYLPVEPHLYVPLVNYFWPECPRWWFGFWALLGIRNEYQQGKTVSEIIKNNSEYCRNGLSYWTSSRYRKLAIDVFGDYSTPMDFYIRKGYGGVARLFRKIPYSPLLGRLLGEVRMNFIVSRKIKDYSGSTS